MTNPYPFEIADLSGTIHVAGNVTFTDPSNQPGGGSQPDATAFRTYGPYPVRYTDVPNDGNTLTLFTPDAGDVNTLIIAQWWPARETAIAWDHGVLLIGQNISVVSGSENTWGLLSAPSNFAYGGPAFDSVWNTARDGNFQSGWSFMAGVPAKVMAVHIGSVAPIQVMFAGLGDFDPPTQGSLDIFFLMGKLAGLYT